MENVLDKAAELLSLGRTESEVAKACGKSRSWVQRLKRKIEGQKASHTQAKIQDVVKQNSTYLESVKTNQAEIQILPRVQDA
ncbi:MAG: hypothetical protein PUP93_34415 [Rhizonema sp. NSF051]|nr:hypothetical protein [Rhizonema sp. NSF051]